MPVPVVKCSYCGGTVNKAQTLSVGSGLRQCRSHPGTGEKSQQVQSEIKKEHEKGRLKGRGGYLPRDQELPSTIPLPKCACCEKDGLTLEQFREVVEKELEVPPEPLLLLEMFSHLYEDTGLVPLLLTPNSESLKLQGRARQMAQTFGFVALCVKCSQLVRTQ